MKKADIGLIELVIIKSDLAKKLKSKGSQIPLYNRTISLIEDLARGFISQKCKTIYSFKVFIRRCFLY